MAKNKIQKLENSKIQNSGLLYGKKKFKSWKIQKFKILDYYMAKPKIQKLE